MSFPHVPVMLHPVIDAIKPRDGGRYLDLTLGAGGHAEAVLARSGPTGRLLGVDRDPRALDIARARLAPFGERITAVRSDYEDLEDVLAAHGWQQVDGIVLDAGVSSMQLDEAERGFSFRFDAPLDMRMSQEGPTAASWIGAHEVSELSDVLYHWGEVRGARRLARRIKEAYDRGELETTGQLKTLCEHHAHPSEKRRRIHPATRVFQALRIAVNDELTQLERALTAMPRVLAPGGVAAVISFHSLEDRRVKRAFRDIARPPVDKTLKNLPIQPTRKHTAFELLADQKPSAEDIAHNPRARSAHLRCLRRVSAGAER